MSYKDVKKRFGLAIKNWRAQSGISQEELAWRANMHRTYIADIERGARNVTLRSVTNLAKALQVTVGNLLTHATAPADTTLRIGEETEASVVHDILLVEDSATDAALTQRALKHAKVTNPL